MCTSIGGRRSIGGVDAKQEDESMLEEQRQSSRRDGGGGNFAFACCFWRDKKWLALPVLCT
jgi:hypothetical protein